MMLKTAFLMRIPFDREMASMYSVGIPMVKSKKEYIGKFQDMFDMIKGLRHNGNQTKYSES